MSWLDDNDNEYWDKYNKKQEEYYMEELHAEDEYRRRTEEEKQRNSYRGHSTGNSSVGNTSGGCGRVLLILFVLFLAVIFIFEPAYKKKQAAYSEKAISTAEVIELNKEYSEKTYRNRLSITTFNDLRKWKGYSFELTEAGTVDVEYNCKRMRDHGTSGPAWVMWRLVDKETGEVLQESEWAKFEHEPFELEKGSYVLEFSSISNQFGFDLRKRPFTFTVHFEAS